LSSNCLFPVVNQNLGGLVFKGDGKVETVVTWWLITTHRLLSALHSADDAINGHSRSCYFFISYL